MKFAKQYFTFIQKIKYFNVKKYIIPRVSRLYNSKNKIKLTSS